MIETAIVNGQHALVQYLTKDMQPATKQDYAMARIVMDNGDVKYTLNETKPMQVIALADILGADLREKGGIVTDVQRILRKRKQKLVELAGVLKANPYRDEKGRWSTKDKAKTVVSFGKDMKAQFAWLGQKAKEHGKQTIDQLVSEAPDLFQKLGLQWRRHHTFKSLSQVLKSNPYHDKTGAFTSKDKAINKGNEEYRQYDTDQLKNQIADHEKERIKHPEYRSVYIDKVLEGLKSELSFRENALARLSTHPDEIADITGLYKVSARQLNENLYEPLVVNGIKMKFATGIGYTPVTGGTYLMMDARVVEGPRKYLTKAIWEIPGGMDALRSAYEKGLTIKGGDFSKVTDSTYRSELGRMLYLYKSPMTTSFYQPMMERMAEAYLENGVMSATPENVGIFRRRDRELNEIRTEFANKPEGERIIAGLERNYTDDRIAADVFRAVNQSKFIGSLVSQDTINDFARTVKQTQEFMKEKYPSGEVEVYRGVQGEYATAIKKGIGKGGEIGVNEASMSSYSQSKNIASTFAGTKGVVITRKIPIKDVLFSWEVSDSLSSRAYIFGGTEEKEVILGSKTKKMVLNKDNVS